MKQEAQLSVLDQKMALLTEREASSYRVFSKLSQPPMAASTQAQFFQLFLQGNNCEDIVRLNPSSFSLGAIVQARIDNDWDQRRQEYQAQLQLKVREKLQQVTLETVERVANEIAASNRLVNDKVLKFLQTGNESELAGTSVGTVKHLREMVDMLRKLTGQDVQKQQLSGSVEHRHTVIEEDDEKVVAVPTLDRGPVTPMAAAQALAAIHKNRGGR